MFLRLIKRLLAVALAFGGFVAVATALALPSPALAQGANAAAPEKAAPSLQSIRFGVLPLGGTVESRALWMPLMADMSRALGIPVNAYSVPSYEELDRAIGRDEIDMAFLSAKMALDAVMQRRMKVVAQIARRPGMPEHRALLLARKAGPLNTLEGMLAQPERWRLARGDSR